MLRHCHSATPFYVWRCIPPHNSAMDSKKDEDLLEYYEERAAILQFDAGLSRAEAESKARRMMIDYERRRNNAQAPGQGEQG